MFALKYSTSRRHDPIVRLEEKDVAMPIYDRRSLSSSLSLSLSVSPNYDFRAPGKFRRNNVTPAFATARDINDAAVFAL